MSSQTRAPTENQLSPLHGPHVLITSHNDEGKAVIKETEPVKVCQCPAAHSIPPYRPICKHPLTHTHSLTHTRSG